MNPYDFVRIDWSMPPARRKPIWHYQLVNGDKPLYSGSLDLDIYAETPLFIADPRGVPANSREPALSICNAQGDYIIPGSSLKGMLRSVVEALGNGCLTLFDKTYEHNSVDYTRKVDRPFQHCTNNTDLCIACRTFGMLNQREGDGSVFLGKVNIGDARAYADKIYEYDDIYTAVLVEPKPHHASFYLDESANHIAGRKFYFHHSSDKKPLTDRERRFFGGRPANRYILPLDRDTGFYCRIDFTALEADEFGALLQAILLEDTMRHKIGYGKPLGLGSVELSPVRLKLVDYATRYTHPESARADDGLTGQAMWDVLYEHTDIFAKQYQVALAMDDLRRIWAWPPDPGVSYYYPSKYKWFNTQAASGKRIKDTLNVPGGQ